jgi:hypothetical protein
MSVQRKDKVEGCAYSTDALEWTALLIRESWLVLTAAF